MKIRSVEKNEGVFIVLANELSLVVKPAPRPFSK